MPSPLKVKGHKKYGGRKKGTLDKKVVDVRAFSQKLFGGLFNDPDYLLALKDRIERGKESPEIVKVLLGYGYGKPPEKIQLTGLNGGPLEITHHDERLTRV